MKRSMHGSTLVETLVMMLVAGIVFLGVMEALSLFLRITAQRSAALYEIGIQRDGFYRLEQLLSTSDSLTETDHYPVNALLRWEKGRCSSLQCEDSVLLWQSDVFRDTLLCRVGQMRFYRGSADTLAVDIADYTFKFVLSPTEREQYEEAISEIEDEFGYEDAQVKTF